MGDTFSSSTFSADGYLKYRPRYPTKLYETILEHHKAHGSGETELAVDLGCGPGIVTTAISPYFTRVIGIDPSTPMITTASSRKDLPSNVSFQIGGATSIPLEDNSVDVILAGTAAHWFPAEWWDEAARVLKKGGTVGVFCYGRHILDPKLPNSKAITEELEATYLAVGYELTGGHLIVRNLYDDLPLPRSDSGWDGVERKQWDRDGISSPDGKFFLSHKVNLKIIKGAFYTGSPVHKYFLAHPDEKGTEKDPVERLVKRAREVLKIKDEDEIEVGREVGLVMVTRSA